MKITAIHAIPLAIPMKPMDPPSTWRPGTRKQIVVRVVTDDGLTGTGEAFAYGAPLAVVSVIDESLAPLLIGQDPLRIEALVDLMHRATMIYGRRGLAMFAISGVEIALWDLLGKALGAPVCALLGGTVRPRLPAYAALARVAAATETPIALGENESTLFGFREIVERRAADILQPSITKVGGISEFRKIAALAQAANVPIAPHSFYFGPGLAATLHVAASFGGSLPVEFPTGELETPFLARPIEAHDGWVEVPQGPGLGVEVN